MNEPISDERLKQIRTRVAARIPELWRRDSVELLGEIDRLRAQVEQRKIECEAQQELLAEWDDDIGKVQKERDALRAAAYRVSGAIYEIRAGLGTAYPKLSEAWFLLNAALRESGEVK